MLVYDFVCPNCKGESQYSAELLQRMIRCPHCLELGEYWSGQLDLSVHNELIPAKMCLCVICFLPSRLKLFLRDLEKYSTGVMVDIYFIHNVYDTDTENRYTRSAKDIAEVRELLSEFTWPGKVTIERENIGEDLGASHFVFNLLSNKYAYFFFINEASSIMSNDWLRPFYDCFESRPNVVACGPKVLKKNDNINRYIIPTTYWGLRSSFGKLMVWPTPKNRLQAKAQEMGLIWHQAANRGFNIAQVGCGDNLLHYAAVPVHLCESEGEY